MSRKKKTQQKLLQLFAKQTSVVELLKQVFSWLEEKLQHLLKKQEILKKVGTNQIYGSSGFKSAKQVPWMIFLPSNTTI